MPQRTQCGINIDPANPKGMPTKDELQDLGAGWVRFVLKVDDSPNGLEAAFNKEIYRNYLSDLAAAGIQILLVLNNETVPRWPIGNMDVNAPEWAAYLVRYAEQCRLIAEHYKGQVAAYEIWNEPDHPAPHPGYNPVVPPRVYGQMLKGAHAAIKGAAPEARVIVGGLDSGNPGWLGWVKAATEGKLFADAVAIHPYGRRPDPNWPTATWGGLGPMNDLLQLYAGQAQPLPLWISEFGTEDANVQGEFPEHGYASLSRINVPVAFWYCWSDGMVPGFGLRQAGGQAKPAFQSYQRFAKPAAVPPPIAPRAARAAAPADARLHSTLLKAAAKHRVIAPDAADPLVAAILADGFVPNSAPFGVELDGVHYRGQRADNPQTGRFRVYLAQGPTGQRVTYVEQEGLQ